MSAAPSGVNDSSSGGSQNTSAGFGHSAHCFIGKVIIAGSGVSSRDLSERQTGRIVGSEMKHDQIIYARVPRDLRSALERERKRMSKKAGAEVKTSAVVRALLEQALKSRAA